MRCAARPSSQRTHTFSHALTRAFSQPLPAGLQQPKASDEPKTAADDGPNPYGARTMSVVLRMNRAEQNAGNFKVRRLTRSTRPPALALTQTRDRAGGL